MLEAEGSVDSCTQFAKKFQSIGKGRADPNNLTSLQFERMFALLEKDKEIVNAVVDYFKKNNKYPTPTQLKKQLPEYKEKQLNILTRRIESHLSKFLEREGKSKGDTVRLNSNFLTESSDEEK